MPHFYSNKIDDINYPVFRDGFVFHFLADDIKHNDSSLILVEHEGLYFSFLKQNRNNKILIKYNKHLKYNSVNTIKKALQTYIDLCSADVISHNLNSIDNQKKISKYLISPTKENIRAIYEKSNNISIEIGFGSGRHLLSLAQKNKDIVFLGIEIYTPAIEQVLNQIRLLKLENLYLINSDCRILFDILDSKSIDSIYLHFPVPWDKNPKKRVFNLSFLSNCERILKNGAFLELRSDSKEYFDYALALANNFKTFDIASYVNSKAHIISKYEARWQKQNKDIYEIRFFLNDTKCIIDDSNCIESDFDFGNLDIKKILDSKKILGSEYFLHIKNIYKFDNGYVLFVLFGSFDTPSKVYLLVDDNGNVKVLGDIIKSKLNIQSLQLIKNWSK